MEGVSALLLAPGSAGVDPLSQLVSFPGAAEIVLAVDNRSCAAERDPFEVRRHDLHPADAAQQIVTAQRRMPGWQTLEFVIRKNPFDLPAHALVKPIARLAQGVIDEEKPAVGKKTPQVFDFSR